MAEITAALVKDLREKTGAGMMDCKNALSADRRRHRGGYRLAAQEGPRQGGQEVRPRRRRGLVGVAVQAKLGVVVEVNSETDFVARNDEFQAMGGNIALALDHAPDSAWRRSAACIIPAASRWLTMWPKSVATIGENMTVRRAAGLHVHEGVIGHYVHGQIADGLGRIGVLVALESKGDQAALAALGRQIAMHVAAASPAALDAAGLDPATCRAREGGAGREERRQAGERAGQDRRVRPEDLLQGGLPRRSGVCDRPREVGRAGA